jgi:uncharacterized protein YaaR (DUF327 family)
MKINPGWRPIGGNVTPADSGMSQGVQQKPFSDTLKQHHEQATMQELNRIMEQIQLQADRLSKSMTVRELRQYKLLVKKFLEETARQGIAIKDTKGWDRRGRGKRYKLLEEIDAQLTALADELLENEQGRIDLLQKIGEIRGMLINYFF